MPRKSEKNFTPDFRSYSTPGKKIPKKKSKKIQKTKKPNFGIIFSQNGIG